LTKSPENKMKKMVDFSPERSYYKHIVNKRSENDENTTLDRSNWRTILHRHRTIDPANYRIVDRNDCRDSGGDVIRG